MIIHLFAVISPGPDFIVVTKQSFSHGRYSALFTSLGISLGILVHVTFCLIGIGYLLSINLVLFKIFKYIGAFYLCFIGFKSLISPSFGKIENSKTKVDSKYFYQSFVLGFVTNVFNPKATLFFLSLFTLVIKIDTPLYIKLFYGFWMSVITGLWFSLVSFFFTSELSKIFIRKYSVLIDKIMGIILIIISIRLLLY